MPSAPIEVVLLNAEEDEEWCLKTERCLSQLIREGLIVLWHKGLVNAGADCTTVLNQHLNTASAILILVGPDSLASDSYNIEMRQSLERYRREDVLVIPVIVRPCDWQHSSLVYLDDRLPCNAKPITAWGDQDEAFLTIAQEFRMLIRHQRRFASNQPQNPGDDPQGTQVRTSVAGRPVRRSSKAYQAVCVLLLIGLCSIYGLGGIPVWMVLIGKGAMSLNLITTGTLVVGSDTTYPPHEFVDATTSQTIGFDIDLIKAIAEQMGLKVEVRKADFLTIMPDLNNKRFDIVISAQTITHDREKQVDFIPYIREGMSLLVKRSNTQHINSLNDLCGQAVGVEKDTVEEGALNEAKKDCLVTGQPDMTLICLESQTDVFKLLMSGRVVATLQAEAVTEYYNRISCDQFEKAGPIMNVRPLGISIRKGDILMANAVRRALDEIKASGRYYELFRTWSFNPDRFAQSDSNERYQYLSSYWDGTIFIRRRYGSAMYSLRYIEWKLALL